MATALIEDFNHCHQFIFVFRIYEGKISVDSKPFQQGAEHSGTFYFFYAPYGKSTDPGKISQILNKQNIFSEQGTSVSPSSFF